MEYGHSIYFNMIFLFCKPHNTNSIAPKTKHPSTIFTKKKKQLRGVAPICVLSIFHVYDIIRTLSVFYRWFFKNVLIFNVKTNIKTKSILLKLVYKNLVCLTHLQYLTFCIVYGNKYINKNTLHKLVVHNYTSSGKNTLNNITKNIYINLVNKEHFVFLLLYFFIFFYSKFHCFSCITLIQK
ncbi:hypothetical protein AGLY_012097 [Aphis glycines]|uniref:Uncharacterized protein n=1 Tax=Aphis glycines TaxID=307491 RepID=A0A6G0T999_APHGL|nr:hypothetical protein AGLY_012097 [Aphis glycines]